MPQDTIKDRIDEFYKDRLSNDLERCVTHFSNPSVFNISGMTEPGQAVASMDHAALRNMLRPIFDTWHWLGIKDQSTVIEGSKAAVRYTLKVKHRSGEEAEIQLMDHLVFDEQGKVSEFTEFLDTAMVARLGP